MDIEKSVVDALVERPSENLSVEIKRWIDPTTTLGIEKIVKGAFALRNRNGGYLLIGFDDKTLQADVQNELPNARELFHSDAIQAIVSRFASDAFEVGVAWGSRDGKDYPVVVIPPGGREFGTSAFGLGEWRHHDGRHWIYEKFIQHSTDVSPEANGRTRDLCLSGACMPGPRTSNRRWLAAAGGIFYLGNKLSAQIIKASASAAAIATSVGLIFVSWVGFALLGF